MCAVQPPPKDKKIVIKAIHEHGGPHRYLWFKNRAQFEAWAIRITAQFPNLYSIYVVSDIKKHRYSHRIEVIHVMPGVIQFLYYSPIHDCENQLED